MSPRATRGEHGPGTGRRPGFTSEGTGEKVSCLIGGHGARLGQGHRVRLVSHGMRLRELARRCPHPTCPRPRVSLQWPLQQNPCHHGEQAGSGLPPPTPSNTPSRPPVRHPWGLLEATCPEPESARFLSALPGACALAWKLPVMTAWEGRAGRSGRSRWARDLAAQPPGTGSQWPLAQLG